MKERKIYKTSNLIIIVVLLVIVGFLLGISILKDSQKNSEEKIIELIK